MAKHIIQEDLDITLKGYVKKFENTPNRVVVTNSNGDIVVKSDLNVSQLDQLKNVTGDIQAQINNKSDVAHTHEDYLTLEELKDIDFSGVAEDIVYNPENSNLESTNVRDAIDEVDNKIEEYIEKLVADKAELKEDIADTNQEIRNVKESIKDLDEALDGKASIDHIHEGTDHTHEDLVASIGDNAKNITEQNIKIREVIETIDGLDEVYSGINHSHNEIDVRLASIEVDVDSHTHAEFETLNENIGVNKDSIAAVRDSVASVRESISNINKELDTKADKDHTHEASDHIHQDILDRIDGFNEDFAEVNERITNEAKRVNNTFAEKGHKHTEYAEVGHTHNFSYEHDHEGVYAPVFHLHSNYADKEHYHNDLYSPIDHSHTGEFAPAVHTHGDLANKEHTHKEFADFITSSEKNVANGLATLDNNGKILLSQLPDTAKAVNIVGTKEERLALANVDSGTIFRETDTADSYIYDGNTWVILADADWANVSLQWSNIEGVPTEFNPTKHNHEIEEINGLNEVLSNKADLDHTHEGLNTGIIGVISDSELPSVFHTAPKYNSNYELTACIKGIAYTGAYFIAYLTSEVGTYPHLTFKAGSSTSSLRFSSANISNNEIYYYDGTSWQKSTTSSNVNLDTATIHSSIYSSTVDIPYHTSSDAEYVGKIFKYANDNEINSNINDFNNATTVGKYRVDFTDSKVANAPFEECKGILEVVEDEATSLFQYLTLNNGIKYTRVRNLATWTKWTSPATEYSKLEHQHLASEIYFEDGFSLQEKVDNNELGGSSSGGGDCNVVISTEAPTNLPVGGIWIDISTK